jgi:hypothetical protein
MRRLATGESLDSLEVSFNISRPVLQKFCLQFAAWFDKEYYVAYIGGIYGVGFDTHAEIVESERLFRAMGLPGILTCMDAVHMTYEKGPYPSPHLFIGTGRLPDCGRQHAQQRHRLDQVCGWCLPRSTQRQNC